MHHCPFDKLKKNMKNIYGKKTDEWLAHLPEIVDALSERWQLSKVTPDEFFYG